VLRWPIRLLTVAAAALLAYGWGDFAADPAPVAFLVLGVLTAVLVAALARLYRPGGAAAFEWDDEPVRRAPGEPVAATASATPAPPRRRQAAARSAAPPAPAPRPHPVSPPPPRPRPAPGGSLWSGERRPDGGVVDLNAAGVAELSPLPGIGRVWAERIVADREARGPFRSVEDLGRLEGFNPAKLPALAGRLRV
jgi:hypothetical protein